MDNFLTTLYFKLFKNTEREKMLMSVKDFDSDNSQIRNDQSISECRDFGKLLRELIDSYIRFKD